MNRQDAFTFTHYTEITDAKQQDVRKLQAELTLSILRGIGSALRKAFKWSQRGDCTGLEPAGLEGFRKPSPHPATRTSGA